ncbi:MAG: glycosyltransferase [Cellulophaga sp.]|nr:glycosyltransferase [Cellulophaga sp.]
MTSIIIPSHNEEKNLTYLLPYLEQITKTKQVEIIVVLSAGNKDHSNQIPFLEKTIFLKCPKNGRADQMNYGVSTSKGNKLVFLHADVKPPVDFIDNIQDTLNSDFDAGFFSYKFDKESFLLNINASFTAKDGFFTGGGDQCLFINKDVFFALGKFDEQQVIMEDFEFFQRMKKNNIPYKIIKNDLVVSARKYESNSYLKVNVCNLLLVLLFKSGYPSKKLKGLHYKLLKVPYTSK